METKKCSKCGDEKFLSDFYKDKTKKYGVSSICKQCNSKVSKNYYKAHKEEIIKKVVENTKKNKEKVKQYHKNYFQAHKEEHRIYNKIYREKTLEHYKIIDRKYRLLNKDRIREMGRKRYRIHIKNITDEYIKNTLNQQGFENEIITPAIIDSKRNIIKIKRIIKQLKQKTK